MKKYLIRTSLIVVIIGLVTPSIALAKIYLDINAPATRRMPIAVQASVPMEGSEKVPLISREIRATLTGDLDFSGVFRVLDPLLYLEDPDTSGVAPGTFSFEDWELINAEALVKSSYLLRADGDVELEFRLYDVFQRQELVSKRWKGTPSQVRRMAHMFSNEIMERITGEKGIFLSSMLYVKASGENKDVFMMDYDGAQPRRLTKGGGINISPTWWPDRQGLIYTSYKFGEPDLFSMGIKGGEERITSGSGVDVGVEFSPAGDRLAFMRNEEGNPDIYIADRRGKIQDRLTWLKAVDVSPSWSPDGKQLAFTSDRYGTPQIFIMNSDGTGVRRITDVGNYNTSPAWSPRGDGIAYTTRKNGRFGISLINPETGEVRRLVGEAGNNEDPVWSPDGRFVAFSSDRTGTYQIYVVDVAGRRELRITSGRGNKTSPAWSPY